MITGIKTSDYLTASHTMSQSLRLPTVSEGIILTLGLLKMGLEYHGVPILFGVRR